MSIDPSIPPAPAPPAGPVVPPASAVSATDPTDGYAAAAPEPSNPYTPPSAAGPPAAATGDNTVAVLSYLTLIGFIIAIVMHKDEKKNRLGAFHLRQSLGLFILSVVWSVALRVLAMALPGFMMTPLSATWLVLVAAWVIGFLAALNRQEKPIPVIGDIIQKQLKGVFAN